MLVLRVLFASLAIISSVLATPSTQKRDACSDPAVRREWRAFTSQEKAAWIQAINCLSHLPHDTALTATVDPSVSLIPPINATGSYYDDIVYVHMDLNTRIHFTGLFLPWHRWYLYSFEQALQEKCGYTGVSPYWNWTIDAPDFYESSFWDDSDPQSGLGGWGVPDADFTVPDGGFSSFHLSHPSPHILRRNFTLLAFDLPFDISAGLNMSLTPRFTQPQKEANSSFSASVIEALLETAAGDFKGFQTVLEALEGPHSAIDLIMGGDLSGTCPENAPSNCNPGPKWSPNEPLFWMNHAMVDKIWYDWQHINPENANSYFGGSVQALESILAYIDYPNGGPPFLDLSSTMPADGMFPEVSIGDVMDTTSGILCYVYE